MITISILKKPLPCWYEFVSGEDGIILKIKKGYLESFLEEIKTLPEEWEVVKSFRKEFLENDPGRKKFNIGERENIGFGGVLRYQGEERGFGKWLISYPEIIKFTEEKCFYCGGLGIREGEKCFRCHGTGKEIKIEMEEALAISGSLMIITLLLNINNANINLFREEEKSSFPQPMTIITSFSSSLYLQGVSLEGEIGHDLARFLKTYSRPQIIEKRMEEAMRKAYLRMMKSSKMELQVFKVEINKGKISCILGVAGKYCGIVASQSFPFSPKMEGYRFESHNVQNAVQQLILLSSLAELNTLFHEAF